MFEWCSLFIVAGLLKSDKLRILHVSFTSNTVRWFDSCFWMSIFDQPRSDEKVHDLARDSWDSRHLKRRPLSNVSSLKYWALWMPGSITPGNKRSRQTTLKLCLELLKRSLKFLRRFVLWLLTKHESAGANQSPRNSENGISGSLEIYVARQNCPYSHSIRTKHNSKGFSIFK